MDGVGAWQACGTKPGGWSYVGRCRSISIVFGEYTDYTRSYHHPGAQFWVGSSRNWSVFLERPNTGRHEKAPVRCPCSLLAALHGAPRTRTISLRLVLLYIAGLIPVTLTAETISICDRNIFKAIAIECSFVFGRNTNAFISRLGHLITSICGERREANIIFQILVVTTVSHPPPALPMSPRYVISLSISTSLHNFSCFIDSLIFSS